MFTADSILTFVLENYTTLLNQITVSQNKQSKLILVIVVLGTFMNDDDSVMLEKIVVISFLQTGKE